jgi:hypothetical protein
MSVRERAAHALDDDFPAVLAALRRGLEDPEAGAASCCTSWSVTPTAAANALSGSARPRRQNNARTIRILTIRVRLG